MDEQRIRQARRLCFFAHYDEDDIVSGHVVHYLAALRDAGFVVVVLSTAELDAAERDKIAATGAYLVLRDNRGMDFGGWIEACTRFFPIEADLLLLANDSVYGPLSDLGTFIDRLTAEEADFYGAVGSLEIVPHLQSWFLLFRPAAYRSEAFAEMMCRPMAPIANKGDIVMRYEIGITQALADTGLRYRAAFTLASHGGIAGRYPYNAAHLLWREVIGAGVPFLKIELLRFNLVRVTDTKGWRAVIGSHAPDMVAMIDADLVRRGVKRRPSFVEMSYAPPIYWPELRRLLLADYRKGEGRGRTARLGVVRLVMAMAHWPRRLSKRFVAPPGR